jgi:hypothetical protein
MFGAIESCDKGRIVVCPKVTPEPNDAALKLCHARNSAHAVVNSVFVAILITLGAD